MEQRARKRPSLDPYVLLKLSELVDRIPPEAKEVTRVKDQFMPALLRCPITKNIMDVSSQGVGHVLWAHACAPLVRRRRRCQWWACFALLLRSLTCWVALAPPMGLFLLLFV